MNICGKLYLCIQKTRGLKNMEEKFPLIGDKFPEMEVTTTHGPKKLPDDYKGRYLVLFSHPAEFTPVYTIEFVAFAKRFEELVVWQKAHQLVLTIYKLTKDFPKEEIFGLTSQFRRAAVSVPANTCPVK